MVMKISLCVGVTTAIISFVFTLLAPNVVASVFVNQHQNVISLSSETFDTIVDGSRDVAIMFYNSNADGNNQSKLMDAIKKDFATTFFYALTY